MFKYDPLGEVSDLEFHRKDSAGLNLTDLTGTYWTATPKASFRYTRDFAGQRRRSLDSLPRAGISDDSPLKHQFQHRYDLARRLNTEWVASDTTAGTSFTLGTDFNAAPLPANRATLAYAMNLVGNRRSRTKTVAGTDPLGAAVAPTVSTYAYDGQDRATTVGGTSPTWDKKDNALTTGNGRIYKWDRRNRLTQSTTGVAPNEVVTTVGYDAEGLRVSKQVGAGTPTRYLVDTLNPTGYGQVLVEYTGDGPSRQPLKTYTYGLDLISQKTISGGLVEFFSTDVLGTTRFLTKFDTGAGTQDGHLGELTTQTFNYDAYGTLVGSTTATAYLYTGEQWDAEVGTYYLRARWYLPEWGRFLSRDSFEGTDDDPVSQNRCLYAHANPVRYVDPSGHMTIIDSMAALVNSMWNRGTHGRMTVRSVRKVNSRLCKLAANAMGRYSDLVDKFAPKLNARLDPGVPRFEAHHILQNKRMMEELSSAANAYRTGIGFAMMLWGGRVSTQLGVGLSPLQLPHNMASNSQLSNRQSPSITNTARLALFAAGCKSRDVRRIMKAVEDYNKTLGWVVP